MFLCIGVIFKHIDDFMITHNTLRAGGVPVQR